MEEMTSKKVNKVEAIKNALDNKGIFYTEMNNGQLKVDSVNIWATKEKWYDEKTGKKGQGFNSFILHLKDSGII